ERRSPFSRSRGGTARSPHRPSTRSSGGDRPMSTTRSISRLSEIAQVMVRHGFGYFLEAHKLSDLLPGRSAEDRLADLAAEQGASSARGQHLREVLDELGPTFVTFGQLL